MFCGLLVCFFHAGLEGWTVPQSDCYAFLGGVERMHSRLWTWFFFSVRVWRLAMGVGWIHLDTGATMYVHQRGMSLVYTQFFFGFC